VVAGGDVFSMIERNVYASSKVNKAQGWEENGSGGIRSEVGATPGKVKREGKKKRVGKERQENG